MIRIKSLISFIFVIIFALALISCQSNSDDAKDKGYVVDEINIMSSDPYAYALNQMMMATGALEEAMPEDVSVNWTITSAANPEIRDSLVAGELDIAALSMTGAIAAVENELPINILSASICNSVKVYSDRPSITTLDDITQTDKISNVANGNASHLAFMLLCNDKYGDYNKFTNNLISMSYPDALISVATSDDLSCSIVGFPSTVEADKIEKMSMLEDLTPIITKYNLGSVMVANKDFCEENPLLIDIFYKVAGETINYMNENPTEAAKKLAEYESYNEISVSDIESQIKSAPPKLEISESAYNTIADLLYQAEIISDEPMKFSELHNYQDLPKIP